MFNLAYYVKPATVVILICCETRATVLYFIYSEDPVGEWWHSTAIVERVNARCVQTKSGSQYKLLGPINERVTLQQGNCCLLPVVVVFSLCPIANFSIKNNVGHVAALFVQLNLCCLTLRIIQILIIQPQLSGPIFEIHNNWSPSNKAHLMKQCELHRIIELVIHTL